MIEELKDIILELSDAGYIVNTKYNFWSDNRESDVEITILGKVEYDDEFELDISYIYPDEVLDTLVRLKTFLNSHNFFIEESGRKILEAIGNIPTQLSQKDLTIKVTDYVNLELKWCDILSCYRIWQRLTLEFKKI